MTGEKARNSLVLALTLTAACVDAVSYLGLDEVLTANMTGNTVLLGLAVARLDGAAAGRSGVALAAFAGGAAIVALLPQRKPERRLWPAAVTAALAVELILLAGLCAVWLWTGTDVPGSLRYVLIALAAVAMGAQSGAVARLGLPGVSTTYVTGTVAGLARDVATRRRASRRRLRLGVLVLYVAGAVAGGFAYQLWGATSAVIPVSVLAGVTFTAVVLRAYAARRD